MSYVPNQVWLTYTTTTEQDQKNLFSALEDASFEVVPLQLTYDKQKVAALTFRGESRPFSALETLIKKIHESYAERVHLGGIYRVVLERLDE